VNSTQVKAQEKQEVDRLRSELSRYKTLVYDMQKKAMAMSNYIRTMQYKYSNLQDKLKNRRSKRVMVSLATKLVSDNLDYTGLIENISEQGVFVRIPPREREIDLSPGKKFEMHIKLPSGSLFSSQCNVVWSCKTPPHNLVNSVGLEVLNPHSNYIDFLNTL
jgi:ATP-dependent 26S proteasome regulatory subunit